MRVWLSISIKLKTTTFRSFCISCGSWATRRSPADASFILWNIDTLDWKNKDSDYLTDYVLKEVNDGNIILFHDIHKTSIDAINKLLPLLYVNGYQVVTVSKLAEVTDTKLEYHKSYRYFKK